jgi:hypothetical protein
MTRIVAVIVFILAFLLLFQYFAKQDARVAGLEGRIMTVECQIEAHEEALATATREKQKIEEEYAEKKKLLQQAIEAHGLSDVDLPADVIRLLKEGSRRAVTVPAASNSAR